MLAMMLPCLGALAEVTLPKVSTDAEKHYYVIKNFRSGKYAYYNGDNSDIKQKVAPTSNDEVNNYIWYLTAEGENYKLHNLGTQYTYAAVNSFTSTGQTVYIKENPYKAGYVVISKNENVETSNSCWDDQDRNQEIGKVGWYAPTGNDNEGTSWTFEELDPATETQYTITDNAGNNFTGTYDCVVFNNQKSLPRTKSIALKNVEWNENAVSANVEFPMPVSSETITNPTLIVNGASWGSPNSRKWRVVEVESVNYVKVQTAGVNQDNVDALWAVYPVLAEGTFKYVIKNLKTNTFVKANPEAVGNSGDGSDVTGATKPVSLAEEGTAFEYKIRTGSYYHFAYTNTAGAELRLSMNGSGDTDEFLGVYASAHSGNDVAFPDYVGNMTFPLNNSFLSSTRTTNLTMISTYNYGSMSSGNFKWYASDNKVKVEREDEKVSKGKGTTSSDIAAHLWSIYPVVVDGNIKYQIKNFATGLFINSPSANNEHNADSKVCLSSEATNFTYGNRSGEGVEFINDHQKRLSVNSSGTGKNEQTVGTYSSHYGTAVTFHEATYSVTVTDAGYATLYTPIAGTLSGTARMITSEDIQDGYITFGEVETSVSTQIPANQGAIVIGEGTYTFTAGNVTEDWSANLLKGSAVNTYVEGEAYVLGNKDGVGLYLAELNKDEAGGTGNTHFLNNAGKAYLPASEVTAGVQALRFNFSDNTTAIESVVAPMLDVNAPIYDLSGRRVVNAVKGGLYIQNGKKFIVR